MGVGSEVGSWEWLGRWPVGSWSLLPRRQMTMLLMTAALVAALETAPRRHRRKVAGPRHDGCGRRHGRDRQRDQGYPALGGRVRWRSDRSRLGARRGSRAGAPQFPDEGHHSPQRLARRGQRVGIAGIGRYEINVPTWMPVKVEGTYIYISVEGHRLTSRQKRCAATSRSGRRLSDHGEVDRGRSDSRGSARPGQRQLVNQGVTITGGNGEFVVETTNGHVSLTNMESGSVDAASINGNIKYDGTIAPSGKFRFSTHNGSIIVAVPESASAAFTVRTYNGSLNTNLPLKTSERSAAASGGVPIRSARAAPTSSSSLSGAQSAAQARQRSAPPAVERQGPGRIEWLESGRSPNG